MPGITLAASIEQSALIDVHAVARLLNCSERHVFRMSGDGRMPRPVRLGQAVRWNRAVLEKWIADGCPSVDRGGQS
jgi:excisionase family DNA binding protein